MLDSSQKTRRVAKLAYELNHQDANDPKNTSIPATQKDFFSFTLYPVHSRVGRGNLGTVLGHPVPIKTFLVPHFGGIAC